MGLYIGLYHLKGRDPTSSEADPRWDIDKYAGDREFWYWLIQQDNDWCNEEYRYGDDTVSYLRPKDFDAAMQAIAVYVTWEGNHQRWQDVLAWMRDDNSLWLTATY